MQNLNKIKQALPDKKYFEYAFHKYFNNYEPIWESWQPWDEWDYGDNDLIRYGKIIVDNIELIKDKRVVDFACHLGVSSLFALHSGASYVVGTNVRSRPLEIAQEICNLAGYNNFEFVVSHLENQSETTKLCNDADVAFITGIMHHIQNHRNVIDAVSHSNVSNLVIETRMFSHSDDIMPVIQWREVADSDVTSYKQKESVHIEGQPNIAWYHMMFKHYGWAIKKQEEFAMPSLNPAVSEDEKRIIFVCER